MRETNDTYQALLLSARIANELNLLISMREKGMTSRLAQNTDVPRWRRSALVWQENALTFADDRGLGDQRGERLALIYTASMRVACFRHIPLSWNLCSFNR